MINNTFFRLAFCALLSSTFFTQANAAVMPPQPPAYIVVPIGTALSLSLNAEVYAEELSVGNAIEFKVRGDVRVNGKVVVAHGARATGMITKIRKACDGQCSEITFTAEEVQAIDGSMIELNSTPHIVKAPCCNGSASATINTLVRANTLDEEHIKD